MARPSKLSPDQWRELERRLSAGESASALAREFCINPSQITRRVTQDSQKAKDIAKRLAQVHTELATLPIPQQHIAMTLADELRSISTHMAGAAKFSAATAHRLAGIAHAKVQEVDDAAPLNDESMAALKNVAVLSRMANDAAVIPSNLLAANKERQALSQAAPAQLLPDEYE